MLDGDEVACWWTTCSPRVLAMLTLKIRTKLSFGSVTKSHVEVLFLKDPRVSSGRKLSLLGFFLPFRVRFPMTCSFAGMASVVLSHLWRER